MTKRVYERHAAPETSFGSMGFTMTLLATGEDTGGDFGLVEHTGSPGTEPPMHVHEREDELFYVLEGEVDFFTGGEVIEGRAGTTVFLPRGVPHTFRIRSSVARMLVHVTPAGFEHFFEEASRSSGSPEEIMTIAGRYGVRFVAAVQAAA